jgi:hypothetical protein
MKNAAAVYTLQKTRGIYEGRRDTCLFRKKNLTLPSNLHFDVQKQAQLAFLVLK